MESEREGGGGRERERMHGVLCDRREREKVH